MAPSTYTVSHRNFSNIKPDYGRNAIEKALASGRITKRDLDLITKS